MKKRDGTRKPPQQGKRRSLARHGGRTRTVVSLPPEAMMQLLEISQSLTRHLSLTRIAETAVDAALALTNAERASLALVEDEKPIIKKSRNLDDSDISKAEFAARVNIIRQVLAAGKPLTADGSPDAAVLDVSQTTPQSAQLSITCVPLTSAQRALGAIYLDKPRAKGPFREDERILLDLLASHVAAAFENAETYRELIRDGLTGLNTHNFFRAQLEGEASRGVRYGRPFATMAIDIDRFKMINDVHGHQTGDEVLKGVSQIVRNSLRSSDVVGRGEAIAPSKGFAARFGGDEFEILLPETDRVGAINVAERVRADVEQTTFRVQGNDVHVTVSIGIASFPKDGADAEALLRKLDEALYTAKRGGRNRIFAHGVDETDDLAAKKPFFDELETSVPVRDSAAVAGLLSKVIESELELDKLLGVVVSSIVELTRAERGFVVLVEDGNLTFKAARNIDDAEIYEPDFQISHSIVREVADTREPVFVANALEEERFKRIDSVLELGLKSVIAVPIEHRDKVLGVIYLDNSLVVRNFTDEDLVMLKLIARKIAQPLANSIEFERQRRELDKARGELAESLRALGTRYRYDKLIGKSSKFVEVLRLIDKVVDQVFPVIIQGESGTGKELVAKAIHYNGPRKDRKFVSENCAAIPETLLESELFGYVKGAFTGAEDDKIGLLEVADGGTLFLDEIGDMSHEMQKKLLRVLEEGEIRPVGGKEPRKVDVRVISASNKDLKNLIAEGTFREDLYYRLNVVTIFLPPLRERKEDIPILVDHFLTEVATEAGADKKHVDMRAIQLLMSYDWKGNVRELRNLIFAVATLSREPHLKPGDFLGACPELDARRRAISGRRAEDDLFAQMLSIDEYARRFFLRHRSAMSASEVAKILGISRQTLWEKKRKWGIP